MKRVSIVLSLAALAAIAVPAAAGTPHRQGEPSIPFVNHGGINDWRSEGDRVIYFQDNHRQWYRATLSTPAFDLPFVEHIGIENRGTDRLDKWATVIVRGQRYMIDSFVRVDAPPRKAKHSRHHT